MKTNNVRKMLALMLLAWSASAMAQPVSRSTGRWYDYDRQQYIGVRFGVSAAQMFAKNVKGASFGSRAGFDMSLLAGQQLGDGVPLFVEGGLRFVQKHVTADCTNREADVEYTMEMDRNYLEVPVVFKYKMATAVDDLSVQPFFGGYFAIGVGGSTRIYPERGKIKTFDSDLLKRMDAGLRLGCGVAFQNFCLELSYDIGLANVARSDCKFLNYDDFDNKLRNGCFSATIGLDF